MTLTTANIITVARLFIAPIFLVFMMSDAPWALTVAVLLFVVGAFSDWLDGWIARKLGEVTPQGEYLDPLADKVLTTAAFVVFTIRDIMPFWMLLVIILRDFGTTALRSIATDRGLAMKTSNGAKVKTFLQMCFIVYALSLLWLRGNAPTSDIATQAGHLLYGDITYAVILLITLFTLWTLVAYILSNRHLLRRGINN